MITRTATDPSRAARRLAFTSSARVAWRLVLEQLVLRSGASVLLPAYIGITDREGSGIEDPVAQTGTPYTLYPLGARLEVDCDLVEARLRTGRHPLLLVVHYFGLVHVDLPRLRRICDAYGVLLVEDCAHVSDLAFHAVGPGSVGHAAFYSLHKVIATPTGGVLRVNDQAMALPTPRGIDRCDPAALEQLVRTDLAEVAALRRANYAWLVERLGRVDGLTYRLIDAIDRRTFERVAIHLGRMRA